jgi:hypothetical protein
MFLLILKVHEMVYSIDALLLITLYQGIRQNKLYVKTWG